MVPTLMELIFQFLLSVKNSGYSKQVATKIFSSPGFQLIEYFLLP